MTILRVLDWSFDIEDARWWGWRWCLHFGPWLIFFDKCGPGDPRYETWADAFFGRPMTDPVETEEE